MARTIVITSRHDLGIEGAKQRISERFEALKITYIDRIGTADLTWEGNRGFATVTSLGQQGTGTVDVQETNLTIEIVLPWLLAPLAGWLEALIRGNADALAPVQPAESPKAAAAPPV